MHIIFSLLLPPLFVHRVFKLFHVLGHLATKLLLQAGLECQKKFNAGTKYTNIRYFHIKRIVLIILFSNSFLSLFFLPYNVNILLQEFCVRYSGIFSFRSGFVVMDLEDVPAGTYDIIPSTFMPNQEGPFILTVKASCQFSLARLQ